MKIRRLILSLHYKIFRNSIYTAKKLGVKLGSKNKILGNPFQIFGSEPWLVQLGNHVEITNGVRFITHDGSLWIFREQPEYKNVDLFGSITVGNNVFIGLDSIIMPGVNIGNNVIIGAGSIVTKDVPDNSIYAGNPAKFISTIDNFLDKRKSDFVYTKNLSPKLKKKKVLQLKSEGKIK